MSSRRPAVPGRPSSCRPAGPWESPSLSSIHTRPPVYSPRASARVFFFRTAISACPPPRFWARFRPNRTFPVDSVPKSSTGSDEQKIAAVGLWAGQSLVRQARQEDKRFSQCLACLPLFLGGRAGKTDFVLLARLSGGSEESLSHRPACLPRLFGGPGW